MQGNLLEDIKKIGEQDDADINVGATALLMASAYHPGLSLMPYHVHLDQLVTGVKKRHKDLLEAGSEDDNATRLAALKGVIMTEQGYSGDMKTTNDVTNGDIIQVIDRRKGLPTTLGLLFVHVCRALDWDIEILSFPANLILRLKKDSDLLIFDPFNECRMLQASDLRALLKTAHGEQAELSSSLYEPLSNKAFLIGIFNFLKLKYIETEDYEAAAQTVELMMALDPMEYRLWLDAGVLFSRIGREKDAIDVLEKYLEKTPNSREQQEAAILLQQIRQSLK